MADDNIADEARAVVFVADYAATDAGGKVNALGAGFTLVSVQPGEPSGAQSVVALIDLPSRYAGEALPVCLELTDDTWGQVVEFTNAGGAREAFRIQQLVKVDRPNLPGVILPAEVPCRVQIVLHFGNGLPVVQGHTYSWRLEIAGTRRAEWSARFSTLPGATGPVFGGPAAISLEDMPPI